MNYVLSICDPKSLGILTDICNSLSLKMTVVLHGRGTAVRSMLDILGIEDKKCWRRKNIGLSEQRAA